MVRISGIIEYLWGRRIERVQGDRQVSTTETVPLYVRGFLFLIEPHVLEHKKEVV